MSMIEEQTFKVYTEEFEQCYQYSQEILDYPTTVDGSGRQTRIHTCFENCKDYKYDDFKTVFTKDTRVNCTVYDNDENEDHERYLLCLYPEDKCEQTVHEAEFGASPVNISWERGLIALLIANPIQFLFELLCIYITKI